MRQLTPGKNKKVVPERKYKQSTKQKVILEKKVTRILASKVNNILKSIMKSQNIELTINYNINKMGMGKRRKHVRESKSSPTKTKS